VIVETTPDRWRDSCRTALARGARFAGLHASGCPGDRVTALFLGTDGTAQLVRSPVIASAHPSIVDLAAGADWDEREAHDLRGLVFDGHLPLSTTRWIRRRGRCRWRAPTCIRWRWAPSTPE